MPWYSPKFFSTIFSVTKVPIIVNKNVETTIKYQLQVGSSGMSIPALCKASIVMPVNSGSVVPSKRFAEKPPETPAKAAARPASGCRPAFANTIAPSGITTT